jgi:hypothetical protein
MLSAFKHKFQQYEMFQKDRRQHLDDELLSYLTSKVTDAFPKHQFRQFGSLAHRKTRAGVCVLIRILRKQVVTAANTYQCFYLFAGHKNSVKKDSNILKTFIKVQTAFIQDATFSKLGERTTLHGHVLILRKQQP